MVLELVSTNKSFGGELRKYKFESNSLSLPTQFNIFLPSSSLSSSSSNPTPAPVLYYLAGLTCNEDTGPWKSGILASAAKHSLAVVFPDTSPRGAGIEGEEEDWDFGTGAGFYLNATSEKYKKNYRMYELITEELPRVLEGEKEINVDNSRVSLTGHSMGGHGSLSIYLKSKAGTYKSCSAFAPITNPTACPWGTKAFAGYLSSPSTEGPSHDATLLLPNVAFSPKILIDYGTSDNFFKQGQLLPEKFKEAARKKGLNGEEEVRVRSQEGYDHSYYFISTFVDEHVEFHAKYLKA
ncbi:esterase D [Mrakia frigida]|uniref:S-formylglutathione hydrolase n=1 Tax=Mrakia frigida TaxID=29902 RepID=UPI003FCC1786